MGSVLEVAAICKTSDSCCSSILTNNSGRWVLGEGEVNERLVLAGIVALGEDSLPVDVGEGDGGYDSAQLESSGYGNMKAWAKSINAMTHNSELSVAVQGWVCAEKTFCSRF